MLRRRYIRDYRDFLNEKYRDIKNLTQSDITADIAKMKGYFSRNSNPERLVNDIKDPVKLVARWIASMVIGWKEATKVFYNAVKTRIVARELLTMADVNKYIAKYGNSLNSEESRITDISDGEQKFRKCLPTLYRKIKELVDEETTIELKSLRSLTTRSAYNMMGGNGRYYAIPYEIVLNNGFTKISVKFDYMTHEGDVRISKPFIYEESEYNLAEFVTLLKQKISRIF